VPTLVRGRQPAEFQDRPIERSGLIVLGRAELAEQIDRPQ
jgi:hypothetical protein